VSEHRRYGAALPPPIGAFCDENRIISDDRLEGPAGRRVAPKGFGSLDKYFADQSRVADQKDIRITRAHPRHGFFVRCLGNSLDIVAPKRRQSPQTERLRRRLKREKIGVGKHRALLPYHHRKC
jgi:hypothetical protein